MQPRARESQGARHSLLPPNMHWHMGKGNTHCSCRAANASSPFQKGWCQGGCRGSGEGYLGSWEEGKRRRSLLCSSWNSSKVRWT